MRSLAFILGFLLAVATLFDAFATILLPRRVNRRFRYSRLYYSTGWLLWRRAASAFTTGRWREAVLGIFGPLSLIGLFASWVVSLILAFALLHWSLESQLLTAGHPAPSHLSLRPYVYFSGTTFFTLGLGDVSPVGLLARALTAFEAGLGFAFLAVIISYLPVLYQAFSRREATISLLDARAGSPPSGGEFLARLARAGRTDNADPTLREWEQWCAELLESHISFPVLAYYRSQHANQSWLAALATILDASALLVASRPARDTFQAQLTFAMARHAAVDIALIFQIPPHTTYPDRLPAPERARLQRLFDDAGLPSALPPESESRLAELRAMYDPFLAALASHFMLTLPPVLPPDTSADNWQRSAWMPRTPGIGNLPTNRPDSSHFD